MGRFGSLYNRFMSYDNETPRLLDFVAGLLPAGAADGGTAPRIVDVGCGRGRMLRALKGRNLTALGVEINPTLVAENRAAGLQCMTPDEWDATGEPCELMIMAHIIEHFAPADLLGFMEKYLARLKPGGHLIVATPLMSNYFYDDFDHVKPYQPVGFMMVFGSSNAQVQYYARQPLVMADLWFRRSPLRPSFHRGQYMRAPSRFFWAALSALGMLAFRASGGLIGRTDGWIGVFRKPA